MRSVVAAAAVLVVLSPAAAFAQAATPTPAPFATDQRPMLIAPASVADPDGADAILFNPAGLDLDESSQAVWIHADRPGANKPGDGDAFFFKSSRLFNLGVEWARPAKDTSRPLFTLSTAVPLGRTFSTGVGFTSTMGKTYSPYSMHAWQFGALWRPGRYVSVGTTAWNAFHEQSTPGLDLRPRYAAGLAIRPLVDRVTLSVDAARTDGADVNVRKGLRGVDMRYGLRAEPIPGLSLYATADRSKRYTAGLAFSFSHVRAGATAFRDENGDYSGSATRVQSSERRQPTIAKFSPAYAKMTLGGGLPDSSPRTIFGAGSQTLPSVLQTLAVVRGDKNIDGVILHLEGFGGGLARAQEVRNSILATRAAGKKILCYMEGADFRTYYVAAACDRIALHPAGTLDISGIAAELAYPKGTLDKLGVDVETARVGPYKSAMEPLIQKEPSKETLEVTNAMLDAVFGQTMDGIAQGRHMDPAAVRAAIDGGYYDPPGAKAAHLVDYVCYPDELDKTAAEFLGKKFTRVNGYRATAPAQRYWGSDPRIGVIYAAGAIAGGSSRSTPLTGESVLGSDTLVGQLKAAGADYTMKAVVLRIDSPGGDGFASDEVWHEIERLKKKKPVVVSMGNVAASGGYYIAQNASWIFADPGTITGSIGVFLVKPNFKGTYEKLDYRTYLLSRGLLSQVFTTSRPWTPEEKEEASRLIETFYQQFITKAAAGRNTTTEAIDAVGRGRVWMGVKAKELRLVDELGGLEDAIAKAKELAHVPKSRRVEWASVDTKGGAFSGLRGKDGIPDDVKAELSALAFGGDLSTLELIGAFGGGPISWSPEAAAFSPRAKSKAIVREEPSHNWLWPLPASLTN